MPFPIHPHMLRHACGYALANAGHDTRALQVSSVTGTSCTRCATPSRLTGSRTSGSDGSPNALDFAERDVMEYLIGLPHQSALMFAARITLAHFSVSSAMCLPKSAGEPGSTVPPRSARRAFILGSSRAALTSLLSLSTMSAGVAFGAPTPNQKLAS